MTSTPRSAIRDRASLAACLDAGRRVKWLLFYGHSAPESGCLSQWSAHAFVVEGVRYPTAEHWMMAEKARLFGDEEALTAILASTHPGQAKRLGRTVRGFEEATWRAARSRIVVAGNVAKFGQDPALRGYILGTQDRVLVEASPRDRIWGIGLGARHPHARQPAKWRGANLLGFALMEARAQLAAAS